MALRVLYVLEIRDTDLLQGDWGVGEAHWMGPLSPHLLALLYLVFGVDNIAPQLMQLLLSVMNIWLVFVLARRLAMVRRGRQGHAASGGGQAGSSALP